MAKETGLKVDIPLNGIKRAFDPFGVAAYVKKKYPQLLSECVAYEVVGTGTGDHVIKLSLLIDPKDLEDLDG